MLLVKKRPWLGRLDCLCIFDGVVWLGRCGWEGSA
jgi:hypothetical protein